MATSFSTATPSLTPKLNSPKALLSPTGPYCGGNSYGNCLSARAKTFSWSCTANYLRLQDGTSKIFNKSFATEHLIRKRTGIWRCATIEEIEAEKSLIEKDVKERMEKTIETIRSNFNAVRTGRANPSMLDRVEIQDVYGIIYETCGQYWPHIHKYILIAIILMQVTMIGLFGLKSKPAASISTIPLLLATLLFNEYCKIRFFPTFCCYSIQNAMENDDHDEMDGLMGVNSEVAINAYRPPCLRPVEFASPGPSTIEPLVSST